MIKQCEKTGKNMSEDELREYTHKEYEADMKNLLAEKGLHDAVKVYCDKIDEVAGNLSYVDHRDIQEFLCDILYLVAQEIGME